MPSFVRQDPLRHLESRIIVYSDNDPAKIQINTICSDPEGLLPDALSGYGAIEIKLSKLLS
jgi:hypothetical protein